MSGRNVLGGVVPAPAREICQTLHDQGFGAWLVGGCVRDGLLAQLGHDRKVDGARTDWDIATNAKPGQVQALFKRVIPTGIQHGTVTVLLGRGDERTGYEVTTLRAEVGHSDGRRPDAVHFVDDIVEDLARRDFTVNAMAYEPLEDVLIDPFGGQADLRARLLRAVGDPAARFAEDGLRVLRAARFVATLAFALEPRTAQAISLSLASYRKVSAERIRDEWLKTMKAQRPSAGFEIMKEHGLLAITAPEILESVDCEQNRFHAFDVWGHAMACLDACPPAPVLRMAGLLHDVGKPRSRARHPETGEYTFYNHERIGADMVEPLLGRLRFSTAERERIVGLVRHHLICYDGSWSDAAVRRWIRRVSPELTADLYELAKADALGKGLDPTHDVEQIEALKRRVQRVLEAGAALSVRDLAIDGRDLIGQLGLAPGPLLGSILKTLLEEVLEEPEQNQRELLLERARQLQGELKH